MGSLGNLCLRRALMIISMSIGLSLWCAPGISRSSAV